MNINLEPSIIPYDNGVIEICFSPEFQRIYDAEVDYIDYIMDCYYEDPIHCKIFTFKDIYQFNKEIEDLKDMFRFEMMDSYTIEAIKVKVMDLCNKFINGSMIAKSSDYYFMWDNQKNN